PLPKTTPLLCGEAVEPKLSVDFSSPTFNPRSSSKLIRDASSLRELRRPATEPPVYRMTITCLQLPDWPIIIGQGWRSGAAVQHNPYITVYEVLEAIYRMMQEGAT
ncbi:hypothetical protein LXA43DRAFT_903122, partial [Ganoderma leucocontextum]